MARENDRKKETEIEIDGSRERKKEIATWKTDVEFITNKNFTFSPSRN